MALIFSGVMVLGLMGLGKMSHSGLVNLILWSVLGTLIYAVLVLLFDTECRKAAQKYLWYQPFWAR